MSACLAPLHLALHFATYGLHIGLTCSGMTHVVLAAPSCSFGYIVLLRFDLQAQLKLYGPNQHGTAQTGFTSRL